MSLSLKDPRDEGRPGEKEWQEFRASFASALLHCWLLQDLEQTAPDYGTELHLRFMSAVDRADLYREDDPSWEWYLVPGPRGLDEIDDYLWLTEEEWRSLYDQLFPHVGVPGGSAGEFEFSARGLASVGLHSALETYFSACLGDRVRGPLPEAIKDYLEDRRLGDDLTVDNYLGFVEFDATRHLFVHNRGVVDERYVRRVADCKFEIGEFRTVDSLDLSRYAKTAWSTARLLRKGAARAEAE